MLLALLLVIPIIGIFIMFTLSYNPNWLSTK